MRRALVLVAVVGFALFTGSADAAAPGTITGYLRDVRTGVNTLVTGPENQPGALANDSMRSHDLVMSGDGRWIVFGSMATNLIPASCSTTERNNPTSTCTRSQRAT